MIPASFDYLAPSSVEEAVAALAEHGDEAKVLAGGQSLLPILRMRLNAPGVIVDLGRIAELRGVSEDGDHVVIGAMTPYSEVLASAVVSTHAALLSKAIATVADPQIRHRGTLGGAIAHADPAGDLLAPVLALDASLVVAGPSGRRTVPAADFFRDLFTTALAPDELLVEVRVPKHTGWRAHYEKFNRVAQAWSMVAVAVTVRTEAGVIEEARVALTNMGSTPIRASGVEAALVGVQASAESIAAAASHAAEGTNPPVDSNADVEYRRHLAKVLTGRAIAAAAGA